MDIRVLRYFLEVVREENISRAADVLHMTQPTLSRQMTQLEEELGVLLFERGKHLALTDAGIMLRRRAEEMVSLMDKTVAEFENMSEVTGNISIGTGGLHASGKLIHAMEAFRKINPSVSFRLYTNNAEHVKDQLEQGLLDFGLLLEPIDVTKFDYLRMQEKEQWGLLLNDKHPLASKAFINRDDLLTCSLIISDRSSVQKEIEVWLGEDIQKLDIFATYNIITNVAMLVNSGAAAALTIKGAVSLLTGHGMVFRPLQPELNMTSVLAWKKMQPNFGASGKFLEYFKSIQKMDRGI